MTFRTVVLLAACAAVFAPAYASRSEANDGLKEKLSAGLKVSKVDTKGEVKEPGAIYKVLVPGLQTEQATSMTAAVNCVFDGALQQCKAAKGFLGKAGGIIGSGLNDVRRNSTHMKQGEEVYISDVRVDADKNQVLLVATSVETKDRAKFGNSYEVYLHAAVRFEFSEPNFVRDDNVPAVLESIYKVFGPNEKPATLEAPAGKVERQGEASRPAPATATKSIQLGDSIAKVEESLGQPTAKASVGPKTIYTYPSLKIIFMDGKVNDVQ